MAVVSRRGAAQNLLHVILSLAFCLTTHAHADRRTITVDDLVRRVQIPLGAVSPDGHFAAYLLMSGDPVNDLYEMTVRVVGIPRVAPPLTVDTYWLTPVEAISEFENLEPSAGEIRWTANNLLVYLTKANGKMLLMAWDPNTYQSRAITKGHDRVSVDSAVVDDRLAVTTVDFTDPPSVPAGAVRDLSWRIRDNDSFWGHLRNPMADRGTKRENFFLALDSSLSLVPVDATFQGLGTTLADETQAEPVRTSEGTTYVREVLESPDGALTATVEEQDLEPGRSNGPRTIVRILLEQKGDKRTLSEFAPPPVPKITVLGWSADSRNLYYINVSPRYSTVNRIALTGRVTELYREDAELERPGKSFGRSTRALSNDAGIALLVRSRNELPAELIQLDTSKRTATVLESPNHAFRDSERPFIRFYPIEIGRGDAYGRLYLPANYRPSRRYPLVITQYISRPGFDASVGDEIPILPLLAHGIAVFAMHARELNMVSATGNFHGEVDRVGLALEAIEWICRKLAAEGIIDPKRVGMSGLSYGAEIAMHAYWKEPQLFRAVSSVGGAWHPSLTMLGGMEWMEVRVRRGYSVSLDQTALQQWGDLSAAMKATAALPPLLLQTPETETNWTVPTWFNLRKASAPVEWYIYPNEGHIKRSPANKWWVYERNMDWFRFWLKGEEDSTRAKVEQYRRWKTLAPFIDLENDGLR